MQYPKFAIALVALLSAVLVSVLVLEPSAHSPPTYHSQVLDPDLTGGAIAPASGHYVAWGSDGVVMRSPDGRAWQQLATPVTANILQVRFDGTGTWVAVGEEGTLLVSRDDGQSWQSKAPQGFALTIHDALNIAPHSGMPVPDSGVWLAVAANGHFLSSRDGGNSWHSGRVETDDDLLTLAFLENQGRLLVGGENGLIGTSEDGAAWDIERGDTQTPVTGFHAFDDLVIGTSAWGRVLLSRDGGESWKLVQAEESLYFNDAAYDPTHQSIVLTSHNGHIFHTDDAGASWRVVEAPYQGTRTFLGDVIFDPQTRSLLAFGYHGAVLQSVDGGRSWRSRPSSLRYSFVKVLYHPQRKAYVGLGPRGFRALSGDAAGSWQVIRPSFDFYWREGAVTRSGRVLIAGGLGQILRSGEGGEGWAYVDVAYPDPRTPPTYRALESLGGGALLAAGPTGLILRSQDEGQNWAVVHHTPFRAGEAFTDLIIGPGGSTAVALEAFGAPYFSADAGHTWTRTAIEDKRNFWHGSLLKAADESVVLAVGQRGLLALSRDGGRTWRRTALDAVSGKDLYGSYASAAHQALFAFGEAGVMVRSTDLGDTWQAVTLPTRASLRRMIELPHSGVLLALGKEGAIVRSTDGGVHWRAVDSGTDVELRAGLIEPGTGYPLAVGRAGTLLRSLDEGLTWERLPTHTQAHFRNGLVHPETGDLFAFGDRIVRLQRLKQ